MKYNSLVVVGVAILGVLWISRKSASANTITKKSVPTKLPDNIPVVDTTTVHVPAVSYTNSGQKVITPVPGTPSVIPYSGATPVQPQPVTIPVNVVASPAGQIQVYNTNSGEYAWTSAGNLPNLIAAGWKMITEDSPELKRVLALTSQFGWGTILESKAQFFTDGLITAEEAGFIPS